MRSYRCYFLNLRTTIAAVGSIEAETDAEAVKQAEALFRAKGAGFTGMEVWVGGRRVPHELDDSSAQIGRWRMKAEELRTAGEGFTDNSSRHHLLNAAETYESLANAAEARLRRRNDRTREAG